MRLPAELRPNDVTAVRDTREQLPLDISPLRTVTGTLPTGDYGLLHLPHAVCLERKSLDDLLCVCGSERERFERELDLMRAYACRALLIESSWEEIERGEWRSKLTPAHVIGSLLGWQESGIPLLLTGTYSTRPYLT
jgi:DNA excision repair protein ERCC-4